MKTSLEYNMLIPSISEIKTLLAFILLLFAIGVDGVKIGLKRVIKSLENWEFSLEKLKIYETCNFHVNLDLQDL